jgi:hypothetical protein
MNHVILLLFYIIYFVLPRDGARALPKQDIMWDICPFCGFYGPLSTRVMRPVPFCVPLGHFCVQNSHATWPRSLETLPITPWSFLCPK